MLKIEIRPKHLFTGLNQINIYSTGECPLFKFCVLGYGKNHFHPRHIVPTRCAHLNTRLYVNHVIPAYPSFGGTSGLPESRSQKWQSIVYIL